MCSILLVAALRRLLDCAALLANKGVRSSCSNWSLAAITCSRSRDSSATLGKDGRPCAGISLQDNQQLKQGIMGVRKATFTDTMSMQGKQDDMMPSVAEAGVAFVTLMVCQVPECAKLHGLRLHFSAAKKGIHHYET